MDKSRLFTPPQDNVPWEDPAIVRVPLQKMDWANRPSQQKAWDNGSGTKAVKNLPNGK